jgi:4-amino-4-deoxy-L-arabinose transferase-like glycosyltransferase
LPGQAIPTNEIDAAQGRRRIFFSIAAAALLVLMGVLMGGSVRRESVTFDEVPHIGAGVSYLQEFDLRMNPEHPPLAKVLAAVPLVIRGTHADYSSPEWTLSREFFASIGLEHVWGDWVVARWNDPAEVLAWARAPMLLLTLALGWIIFACARRLGGDWGGLLCLTAYVSAPVFLAFGPLVLTDVAVTLFSLTTLWKFGDVWRDPSRKNAFLFGLNLAGALLSKFSAGLLFYAFVAFALSTLWRPVPGQPATKPEARAWRRVRRRATGRGILVAAAIVYLVYFILSVHQPTDALYRLGQGTLSLALRHLLMPPMLYIRGVFFVAYLSSRPMFLLGHAYKHGMWFYFPVLFLFKSQPGFLGLLILAPALAIYLRRRAARAPGQPAAASTIPPEYRLHWRVLWVSLIIITAACMAARLNISFRHFSIPIVLLILSLAPLPRILERLRAIAPLASRVAAATAALLAMGCLATAVEAYPFYIPYLNAFGFGRPVYALVNSSNVDWDQALPEVERFAEQHGLQTINVDSYSFYDPTDSVPRARLWNCQTPAPADAGQWVAVSANFILDAHNCVWLMDYPHEALGGGSMYAVQLPAPIPAAGSPGGPPLPPAQRQFMGAAIDMRFFFIDLTNHPEKIVPYIAKQRAAYIQAHKR